MCLVNIAVSAAADRPCRFNGEAIVFLVGGDAPKRFIVHEGLVKPRSDFVRLALRGDWKEAQERTIPLPEDDPNIFSVYQRWLYAGLIHTRPNSTTTLSNPYSKPFRLTTRTASISSKCLPSLRSQSHLVASVEKCFSIRSTIQTSRSTRPM